MKSLVPETNVLDAFTKKEPESDPLEDGSVGQFLSSVNNYERLWEAENSVLGYSTASKKQKPKLNKKVREAVNPVLNEMFAEGSVKPGAVQHTYQSSFDQGNDFGGEVALEGVYGNEYVLHGHYDETGATKPGSVGLKHASDPTGMRIAHGVDDALGGDPSELFAHYNS